MRTVLAAAAGLLLAGCAAPPDAARSPSQDMPPAAAVLSAAAPTTGLSASAGGYWLVSATPEPTAVRAVDYRFQVLAPDGSAVTSFLGGDDSARVYAVRSDLTGLRRTVPANLGEGVWSARLGELDPGLWRIYVAFAPDGGPGSRLLLSRTLTVPGPGETSPLDPVSATASVDGLTLRLGGRPVAGRPALLRLTVTRPAVQLEPLDGGYAQLTAVRDGDLALAPFTPLTPALAMAGGPTAEFRGRFPEPGAWRVFVQFRTEGQQHTATFTVRVRSR
ncbi:hypothetical protein ACEZCY_18920 [Streptacidiphilus sp. N1-12]|uniref:Secreted protein n=2 Tax=Streptacidiphilus alkalitolerans TaxID=3342712 RepID=A0ABV6VBS8_9ACTN